MALDSKFQTVFPLGPVNPYGKFFTGTTYLTMLSDNDSVFNAPIGSVTFQPGARTHWHVHSGGQILLITAGSGIYQQEGNAAQHFKAGDVIRIPPNVKHWHGALAHEPMEHISIETNAPVNKVTWLDPVTDEQYEAANRFSD